MLGIDAVGNQSGGGLRVLTSTLRALKDADIQDLHLWCTLDESTIEQLPWHTTWTIHRLPRALDVIGRVHWFQTRLQRELKHHNIFTLLSLNGMGRVHGVRQVVLLQQPLLYSVSGLAQMPTAFIARMLWIRAMTTATCANADVVVVQTPSMACTACAHLGIDERRVQVLTPDARYLGEENNLPKMVPDISARVLYVGHDAPYKNMDMLYNTIAWCHTINPEITLTVTHLAKTLPKHPPWLRAIGPQPQDAIDGLLRDANVLVMPSLAETVGLPMIEAMSLGCPVIAADLPYAHDICHDAALYAHPCQVREWVTAILDVFTREGQAQRLAQRGLERARELANNRPYHQLVDILLDSPPC